MQKCAGGVEMMLMQEFLVPVVREGRGDDV